MKNAIFLSAREKATRLLHKHLLEISGKPTLEHLIDRLKLSKLADLIVLCTSVNPQDATLVEIAKKNGIEYFRGSEDDKLDRYLNAAKQFGVDFVAVVDGDDLFCDPEYIDKIFGAFEAGDADYITCKGLPLGVTAFGVRFEALRKVCELKDESDTEVWGGYFMDSGLFKPLYLGAEDLTLRHPEYRMTLDYKEDFEFFKAIFDKLYVPGKVFSLKEIMALLEKEPEILAINRNVQELYEAHIAKSAPVKFKKDQAR